jgi:hypothetical protein
MKTARRRKIERLLIEHAYIWPVLLCLVSLAGCGGSDNGGEPNPVTPSTTQVLLIGNAEGAPGDTVNVALSLETTEPLSGLQFDLLFDPAVLAAIDVATTTRSAGFEAFGATGTGAARVLLVDSSGTAEIPTGNGDVVTVTMVVNPGATAGATAITTANGIATDRSATPLTLGGATGTFTVR